MAKSRKIKAYERGHHIEALAAFCLRLKGYKILKSRYKTPGGEIDLVARRKNVLVFVEVKGRSEMQAALESVTARNQARVEQAARYFIAQHPQFSELDMRFDVVVFVPPFSLHHLDNAWAARS